MLRAAYEVGISKGYERIIRDTGRVTTRDIEQLGQRMISTGDPRDVLPARDWVMRVFGFRRFGPGT